MQQLTVDSGGDAAVWRRKEEERTLPTEET